MGSVTAGGPSGGFCTGLGGVFFPCTLSESVCTASLRMASLPLSQSREGIVARKLKKVKTSLVM